MLSAAGRLFDARGVDGTTLSAVAREVGLAKSNLYRYFESREAILMQLYVDEFEAWSLSVGEAMRPLHDTDDCDGVVDALVRSMVDRRRLVELSVAVAAVLEHNVGEDTVIQAKRGNRRWISAMAESLLAALPSLSIGRIQRFLWHFCAHAIGAWPDANPSEVVQRVQARPEFAETCIDFEDMLRDHGLILLRGLTAES